MTISRRISRFKMVAILAGMALSSRAAIASDYHVGQNQPLTTLSSVPWDKLLPGDNVYIHAQSQPYRENILISQSGTAANHIRIVGVADPVTHLKPVIDGANATQSANIGFWATAFRDIGAVIVSPHQGFVWGTAPSYIDIENLDIRNANQTNTHTNCTGQTINYGKFACALYVECARHLIVRNCELSNSGNGFFVNSKYGGAMLSSDILVESCYIHHNGNPGSPSEHNCYTEANGIVYQYNRIGPLAAGSNGDCIKDRSANTIVRNNWIEPSGFGQAMELICSQSDAGTINLLPGYDKTYVYGNVIDNGPTGCPILVTYGGDMPDYSTYRHGTLYFYNNTIFNHKDRSPITGYSVALFLPPLKNVTGVNCIETIDCRNNVIYSSSATPGAVPADFYLLYTNNTPTLNLATNWMSPAVTAVQPISNYVFAGTINGLANNLTNSANDPGFSNPAQLDLRPASGSQLLDSSGPQAIPVAGAYDVTNEFLFPMSFQPRAVLGNLDIGALEGTSLATGPSISVSNSTVKKSANSPVSAQFIVNLLYPAKSPVAVNYTTVNGSAIAGVDYTAASGVLNIPVGSISGSISVPVIGNGPAGSSVSFSMGINSVIGGVASNLTGLGTINYVSTQPPVITSFTPTQGLPGSTVTVNGTNLSPISSVTIGGMNINNVTSGGSTSFTFVVPSVAKTGLIKVNTSTGSSTGPGNFTVLVQANTPTITSINPGTGPVGTVVTVTGTNFTGATAVSIHDVPATFTVINSTTIQMTIPAGATNSKIRVDTPKGTCWSPNLFIVI